MSNIFSAALLMMFIVWAHKALVNCYQQYAGVNNTNDLLCVTEQPKTGFKKYLGKLWYFKKLIITILLFLGCYYFVTFHAWTQKSLFLATNSVQNINQNKTTDNYDNADNFTDGSKDPTNPQNNNFIDILAPNKIKTKFHDVAGMAEVKDEVRDIIQFLQNPKQFSRLGAKAPKGLLMYGPPGTGKTLLARAIAGESNVTFIAVSGSQFEEEYVGIGASRVRQLFHLARLNAPCIIFIDEIDAVAFKRNSGKSAPWLAQTVNQLLTDMDGLNENKNLGIVVIAATNRLDVLDPAILRPGRFDRQVKLELPTLSERQSILSVHLKNIKFSPEVDPQHLARLATGFSGADLANLINEAAIHATKQNKHAVELGDFDYARDRIVLGSKRESLQMSEQEKKITAYHEAGHTLVALSLAEHEPLYKVTISPRGLSLGHTAFQPEVEKYSYSKVYIEHSIAATLSGRIAESLIFGEQGITTGAENDFKSATDLAYKMVTQWGFSKRLKTLNDPKMRFVDKAIIEQEIQEILDKNYKLAQTILQQKIDKLHKLAAALLEKETLEADEVKKIIGYSQ